MNARSIKKRLMRGRVRSFWGPRAYVTVRLPLSLFPEPCPPGVSSEWTPNFLGYERIDGEQKRVVRVSNVSSAPQPQPVGHFYAQGEQRASWWTIEEGVERKTGPGEFDFEIVDRKPGSLEMLTAHVERDRWIRKWLGGYDGATGVAVLDEFLDAGMWAKTTYPQVGKDAAFITYSVKWFYANRKLRFCSDLARAMRIAKAHGVDARIVGGAS